MAAPATSLPAAHRALAAGDWDAAAAAFTALLQARPADTEARLGLARTLALSGHPGPALDLLTPFFASPSASANAPATAWFEAALIHRLSGGLDAARRTL